MEQFNLDFRCTKYIKASIVAASQEEAIVTVANELKKQFSFVELLDCDDIEFTEISKPLIENKEDKECDTSQLDTMDVPSNKQDGGEEMIQEESLNSTENI